MELWICCRLYVGTYCCYHLRRCHLHFCFVAHGPCWFSTLSITGLGYRFCCHYFNCCSCHCCRHGRSQSWFCCLCSCFIVVQVLRLTQFCFRWQLLLSTLRSNLLIYIAQVKVSVCRHCIGRTFLLLLWLFKEMMGLSPSPFNDAVLAVFLYALRSFRTINRDTIFCVHRYVKFRCFVV